MRVLLDTNARDYEDAVQGASLAVGGLDAIVMRDIRDYETSALPVYSPATLLHHLAASGR